MRRRDTISLIAAAVVWPRGVWAQSARKPVVGVLFYSTPEPTLSMLREALANIGYRDGETIQLEVRVADGSNSRLAEYATELVDRKVDLIIAVTTPAALAAKAVTASIPIVMGVVADAVGSKLVASLARPGGNITGLSGATAESAAKILGLLREAIPTTTKIGVLVNATDPFHVTMIEQIEVANRIVKSELHVFKITKPDELAAAFETIAARGISAVIAQPTLPQQEVIDLASRHRLPIASPTRSFAQGGGLLSYSGKYSEMSHVVAGHVDKILKGTKPAEIPVQLPTQFEFAINLKTARALGLEIPPFVLAQADVVIE